MRDLLINVLRSSESKTNAKLNQMDKSPFSGKNSPHTTNRINNRRLIWGNVVNVRVVASNVLFFGFHRQ